MDGMAGVEMDFIRLECGTRRESPEEASTIWGEEPCGDIVSREPSPP